jgi:hypothetical protein
MTRKYFSKLSEPNQYRRLLLKGVCIAERTQEGILLLLFQLDRFYVEVAFDNHSDEVLSARSFEDTDELWPYLKEIRLPYPR